MQRLFWVTLRVSRRLQVNEGYQDGGRYFPVAVPIAACRIVSSRRAAAPLLSPACAWETCRPSWRGLRRRFCHQEHWQQHNLQYLGRFSRPQTMTWSEMSRDLKRLQRLSPVESALEALRAAFPCKHYGLANGQPRRSRRRQPQPFRRTSPGSLAKFAAMRRASSRVSSLAAERRPGSSSK